MARADVVVCHVCLWRCMVDAHVARVPLICSCTRETPSEAFVVGRGSVQLSPAHNDLCALARMYHGESPDRGASNLGTDLSLHPVPPASAIAARSTPPL